MMDKNFFICIGAQKSGTSWLYANLNKLPTIDLPPIKEIHYFDRSKNYPSPNKLKINKWQKRILNIRWSYHTVKALAKIKTSTPENFLWYKNWYFGDYSNPNWYKSIFEDRNGITGDITPAYSILDLDDVKEMRKVVGNVPLIFMVRNPIDRAWSSYKYKYRHRLNNFNDIDEKHFIQFIDSSEQTLRSDYLRTIHVYQKVFNKGNFLIVFFDAIKEKPQKVLNVIVKHIGGDIKEIENIKNISKKINTSKIVSMPDKAKDQLIKRYEPKIFEMSAKYGGYFTKWEDELKGEENSAAYPPTILL
jgi:hypothetical protein